MPRKFTGTIATLLLLVAATVALPNKVAFGGTDNPSPTSDAKAQVSKLIEQLGHENFRVRMNAQTELEKIGLAAYEQLREALEHKDIQIARSAEYLLRSQNVVWWLESDSHEVRSRLQEYSSLSNIERQTRLFELSALGTDDALLALCRIAKFESIEWCSRSAAISLLKKLSALDVSRQVSLCQAIVLTIGKPNRAATNWLISFANQSLQTEVFRVEQWIEYADGLNLELAKTSQAGYKLPLPTSTALEEQKSQVLQFYEWMVAWIGKEEGRQKALESARPSLILVSENLHAVREYCTWALSLRLPELVIELLDSSKPHLLTDDPQLHYLLAEAYRAHDKEVKAQEMALRARRLPAATAIRLGQLVRGNTNIYQIEQRINQAILLDERGMFDWEEEEYIEAIALSPNSAAGHRPRYLLAELYREGKQYDKAVDVMKIVAENIPPDSQLPLAEFDYPNLMASYHWYRSLLAQQKNQPEEAMAEIRKACAFNIASRETNPDILINLHRIAKSNEDREFFREHFNKLVESYRHEVTREESQLAESTFTIRNSKLAKVCNQLAWLLASCETSVDEAIYLSERSLEFDPEVNTYLDTLARCYFAAGRYEDAVKSQLKALKGSPHNRAMKAQLEEFQLALEQKSKLPKDDNGKD